MKATRTRQRTVPILGATCITLAAFNARPFFTSTAAVLPDMTASLHLSGREASIVTALPIICMGLFAPFGARIGNKFGVERGLVAGILLLNVALALRSAGPVSLVFSATIVAGLAIAIVNVLLPVLVKRRFHDRVALLTSFYTTGIGAGAAAGAALTLPLARALNIDWRVALLCWSAPGVAALLIATALVAVDPDVQLKPPPRRRGLWRDSVALRLTLFFSLHSGLSYTVFGWLAPVLTARGMSATGAGYVVAQTIAGQMVGTLIAPHVAARMADQRWLNVMLASGSALLLAGMFLGPVALAEWIGPIQGLFQGSLLAVSMMLVVARSSNPETAAGVSAMVQSAGMIGAGTTPFLVGLLYDHTGTFFAPALLISAVGAGAAAYGYAAGLPGMVLAHRE